MSATMKPMLDPGRRAESTSSGAFASAAMTRGATSSPSPSGIQRLTDAMGAQSTGGGRDQRHARDALGEQLGVTLGEGDDRHAAHRVTDQDDLALRRDGLDDAGEVVAELVDRGVLPVGPVRPAVRALVVERHPALAAERLALEVPAVEVERIAVREDQGHVVAGTCDGGRSSSRRTAPPRRPRRGARPRRRRSPGPARSAAAPSRSASAAPARRAFTTRRSTTTPVATAARAAAPRPAGGVGQRATRAHACPLPRPRRGSAGHPCG